MASMKLDRLTLKQLMDLDARVRRALGSAKERERATVQQELAAFAQRRGFSVAEVFGGRGRKGGKVAVKFRNKENSAETWTGRGRQPKWLSAKLSKGAKLSDFAI